MKSCQHIIDRIKSHAAQPYGTSNYGMGSKGNVAGGIGLTTGALSTRLPIAREKEY